MNTPKELLEEAVRILETRKPRLCGGMHELRNRNISEGRAEDHDGLNGLCPDHVRETNALCAHNDNGDPMAYQDVLVKLSSVIGTGDEWQELSALAATVFETIDQIAEWDSATRGHAFLCVGKLPYFHRLNARQITQQEHLGQVLEDVRQRLLRLAEVAKAKLQEEQYV